MDPEPISVEHDGLRIGGLDWGGDGPPLLLLHPNGFCAGLFDPLAQALRGEYRLVGVDLRGHGTSEAPSSRDRCRFVDTAGDVLAVLDALGISETLTLGESLGGAAAILVDRLRPGLIRRALLCEAIASEPIAGRPGGVPRPGATGAENPMAAAARRRRAVWPDRAAVVESYGSRPPLNVLEVEALEAYARWGFHDRPDGQVELACPPEVEAWYFEGGGGADGPGRAFAHLSSLSAPVTVVGAEDSNLPEAMFAAQADAAGAPLLMVQGSHFFLQEDTARGVPRPRVPDLVTLQASSAARAQA